MTNVGKKRIQAIKDLISQNKIANQQELEDLLKQKYSIVASQPAISRDLQQIGVTKKKIGEEFVYEIPETNVQLQILKLGMLEVTHNESLIVVKTRPGLADFIGDFLDNQKDIEILGTIAGENTVFIAPKSVKNIKKVVSKINKLTNHK
ncbi:MAG: Arginine repressor [candidate division TM6 bacterium GW2011_GWF2_32_72]|nr:MAG: Arginine repressor [candidate division TM6 bacterium GW2011_GWF2_32_72]